MPQTRGEVKVEDIAKSLFAYADGKTITNLTSIFNQAAMADGNADLTQIEFETAIKSDGFKQVVEEHTKSMNETMEKAKDPSCQKAIASPNSDETSGTPRDHVVAEKGEWFANEIWDPMKRLADEALQYMQENNGTLEKFSFTGFPHGVRILQVVPAMNYSNSANDTMSIVDGQPQVTRHVDCVQALVIFEHCGETYKIFSDQVADDATPWRNPSFNE